MAAKGHGLDWLYDTGSPEETSYDEFYSHMDVTLMGRRTFQEIEKTGDPASVYPTTENYVFTHRALSCPGFTAVNGDPVEFVKDLGQDRSIWVVGGNTILAPLLDQDMVDCLIVQVAPVLLGAVSYTHLDVYKRQSLRCSSSWVYLQLSSRSPSLQGIACISIAFLT